jgi:DNA-directed RNA polymerase subunit RPC12/RpoP
MDELKRLDTLIKSVNRGGYFRCPICNTVSNPRIETNIGDYKEGLSFTHDPKDSRHYICVNCDEVIEEQRQDYAFLDREDTFLATLDQEDISIDEYLKDFDKE